MVAGLAWVLGDQLIGQDEIKRGGLQTPFSRSISTVKIGLVES
jgi:hypothetical protein